MKRFISIILFFTVLFTITACKNSQPESLSSYTDVALETEKETDQFLKNDNGISEEENTEMRMKVQIGDSTFIAVLENNATTDALVEMMENEPIVIQMNDYAEFEKVGSLGKSLPADNSQITTKAGEIVLYQGNQIVMFYGSNSWSYTRIGRIDDLTGWEEALGSGDVAVSFSLDS